MPSFHMLDPRYVAALAITCGIGAGACSSSARATPGEAGTDAGSDGSGDAAPCTVVLPGDCAGPVAAYSVNGPLLSTYPASAPLFVAVRIPDGATTDVLQAGHGTFAGGSGTPDVTQLAAWLAADAPGSYALVPKVYDQSGHGNDATQGVLGSAPILQVDTIAPGAASLSLLFSNATAVARAGYTSGGGDGNALVAAAETDADPTTMTLAALTPPSGGGYPPGAPYPLIPTPDYWVLPGFLVQDKSLGTTGVPAISATATTLVLDGQPSKSGFSKSLTITPTEVWLDLPATLQLPMAQQSVLLAARSGASGTLSYVTFGANAEAAAGAAYSTLSTNGQLRLEADDPSLTTEPMTTVTLATGPLSNDVDVYRVVRDGGSVAYDVGELGAGSMTDGFASTAMLSAGSIGYTQQVALGNNIGDFEAFGLLVFDRALAGDDATTRQAAMRTAIALPAPAPTQIVYTGASTVIGHGIARVEAPAKRIGEDLEHQGHAVRTFTLEDLSEALLADLENAQSSITQLRAQGTGTNVLVIHATISDEFDQWDKGGLPEVCTDAKVKTEPACLWSIVQSATMIAHTAGWKVMIVGGEPKLPFFGAGGHLADFHSYKALESAGWQAAGADAYVDLETDPYIGGTDGHGGYSDCPFWNSACSGTTDTVNTSAVWQPDGAHFQQAGYDHCADVIAPALIAAHLY